MTTLKILNKLGNALRAQSGILIKRGNAVEGNLRNVPWKRDVAPRKDAATQERIDRWQFRLKQKAVRL